MQPVFLLDCKKTCLTVRHNGAQSRNNPRSPFLLIPARSCYNSPTLTRSHSPLVLTIYTLEKSSHFETAITEYIQTISTKPFLQTDKFQVSKTTKPFRITEVSSLASPQLETTFRPFHTLDRKIVPAQNICGASHSIRFCSTNNHHVFS